MPFSSTYYSHTDTQTHTIEKKNQYQHSFSRCRCVFPHWLSEPEHLTGITGLTPEQLVSVGSLLVQWGINIVAL